MTTYPHEITRRCLALRAGVRAVSLAAVFALAACGGGGGSDSATAPAATNQTVGGIWSASYSAPDGSSIQAVLLTTEDGRSFGIGHNLRNNCVVLVSGNLASSGSTLTGSAQFSVATYSSGGLANTGCTYPDGSTYGASSISGTVSQHSTMTMTSGGQTSGGLALPTETHTFQYEPAYDSPSSLA